MGGAYALTYIPYYEGFGIPVAEAMKCEIPIISGDRTSLPEVAGDAAIYCDPFHTQSITEAMMNLTSDENLYNQLQHASRERSKLFSWDESAKRVWSEIERLK
jgi:glycosyltransferase involved in cell wall biosynthesis